MTTRLLTFISLLLATAVAAWGQSMPSVTVDAGDFDRRGTIVSFMLPEGLSGSAFRLVDEAGARLPVQVDTGRTAWFILDELAAGTSKTYQLEDATDAEKNVVAEQEEGAVSIGIAGEPVLTYHVEETPVPGEEVDPIFERSGYIHPVYTPSGKVITGDYPEDHLHHHGIWAAWTNTVFQGRTPDFWNMGGGHGRVEAVALDDTWSGPVQAGFHTRHRYIDLMADEPVTALNEEWTVRVYDASAGERPYRIFDLDLSQTTATDSALVLPEYRYGGVGFRGRDEWNGAENTFFLTSEGRDRSDGHATTARWCHVGGMVDGELAGIAILGHPDNFRAPQPMRIHPTEPFFNYAPSQAGDWAIEPGTPYEARYRYVVYDGPPNPDEIDRLWNDYAHPPAVRVHTD